MRQSLLYSRGNFSIFFLRPISAVLIVAGIVLLVLPALFKGGEKRRKVVEELSDH
jgi:TctA family transporter